MNLDYIQQLLPLLSIDKVTVFDFDMLAGTVSKITANRTIEIKNQPTHYTGSFYLSLKHQKVTSCFVDVGSSLITKLEVLSIMNSRTALEKQQAAIFSPHYAVNSLSKINPNNGFDQNLQLCIQFFADQGHK